MYFNRVLKSTIGLEVLGKPINFENILNVRQILFDLCFNCYDFQMITLTMSYLSILIKFKPQ